MNRLQKKCFIVTAGVHLLLGLILIVGPAFLTSNHPPDDSPILDFVPVVTTDAKVSGGGDANVHSAPPAPLPPPQPAPAAPAQAQPEKVRDPEPPKPLKEVKQDPDSLELSTKKKKIEISTTPVIRKPDANTDAKARAEKAAREEARAQAAARARLASQLDKAASAIGNGVSGGTDVKLHGPDGGGLPYANFDDAVKSAYTRAWNEPNGVTDEEATVTASVTIARDGSVVSARIVHSSGNSAVDRSVQNALDRVTYAAPLPADGKENQRTVTIDFKAKPRRSIG